MRRLLVFLVGCAGSPSNVAVAPVVLGPGPAHVAPPCSEKNAASCEPTCAAGKQEDCAVLASMLATGNGAATDYARAHTLADSSCHGGVLRGCNVLAYLLEDGRAGAKDEKRALELYTLACDGREWRACSNLGRIRIAAKDLRGGVVYHERACRLGGLPSCLSAGSYLAPGGGVDEPARAADVFRIGCDGGDLDCCNGLGTSYARGAGVAQDDARAIELFKRACDGGVGIGCKGLGDMYAPTDPAQAMAAYKHSCELGYARGCERAGMPSP